MQVRPSVRQGLMFLVMFGEPSRVFSRVGSGPSRSQVLFLRALLRLGSQVIRVYANSGRLWDGTAAGHVQLSFCWLKMCERDTSRHPKASLRRVGYGFEGRDASSQGSLAFLSCQHHLQTWSGASPHHPPEQQFQPTASPSSSRASLSSCLHPFLCCHLSCLPACFPLPPFLALSPGTLI